MTRTGSTTATSKINQSRKRLTLFHQAQQIGSIDARHPHVRHDVVEESGLQLGQGLLAAAGASDIPHRALGPEETPHRIEQHRLVVHEENPHSMQVWAGGTKL
jgi:hypothetical protein